MITEKDKNGYIQVYDIHANNIDIENLCHEITTFADMSSRYVETGESNINLRVGSVPVEMELDPQMMERLAAYNLNIKNKTLVKEIEYHESKLGDLKTEIDRLSVTLDKAKGMIKDMVEGAEFERVDDWEDDE
jgi:hypothetical protein